jgi:uncharacterized membrane protein
MIPLPPPKADAREVKTQKVFDAVLILIVAVVLIFVFQTRSKDRQSESSDRAHVSQIAEAIAK